MSVSRSSASIVISSPLSFVGSAQRIWRRTDRAGSIERIATRTVALLCIVVAWAVVLVWYLVVGFLVVPYRLVRREERRRQRDELQLLEMRRVARATDPTDGRRY